MIVQSIYEDHKASVTDPRTGETVTVGELIIDIDEFFISTIVQAPPFILVSDEFLNACHNDLPPRGITIAADAMFFAVETDSGVVGYQLIMAIPEKAIWYAELKFYYEHVG